LLDPFSLEAEPFGGYYWIIGVFLRDLPALSVIGCLFWPNMLIIS